MATKYRLRAECLLDLEALKRIIEATGHTISEWSVHKPLGSLPDVDLEFACSLPVEAIRHAIETIPDGHVMRETLAIWDEYTGARSYSYPDPAS